MSQQDICNLLLHASVLPSSHLPSLSSRRQVSPTLPDAPATHTAPSDAAPRLPQEMKTEEAGWEVAKFFSFSPINLHS